MSYNSNTDGIGIKRTTNEGNRLIESMEVGIINSLRGSCNGKSRVKKWEFIPIDEKWEVISALYKGKMDELWSWYELMSEFVKENGFQYIGGNGFNAEFDEDGWNRSIYDKPVHITDHYRRYFDWNEWLGEKESFSEVIWELETSMKIIRKWYWKIRDEMVDSGLLFDDLGAVESYHNIKKEYGGFKKK